MKTVLVPYHDELLYRTVVHTQSYFRSILVLQMFLLLPVREFSIIHSYVIHRKTLRGISSDMSVSFTKVRMIKLRALDRFEKLIIKYIGSDIKKLMEMIRDE